MIAESVAMCRRARRATGLLVVAWIAVALIGRAGADEAFERAVIRRFDRDTGRVEVRVAGEIAPGARLALFAGTAPLGWGALVEAGADGAAFEIVADPAGELAVPTAAWIVAPDAAAKLLPAWPVPAPLFGSIDVIAPGMTRVWVRGGANVGVSAGDSWLYNISGQPVARLDVRAVDAIASYCSVTRLAADLPLKLGQSVELWPAPGLKRTGRAASAVAFVEGERDAPLVWIAAPPGVACPAPPHVDFYRNDTYVGHGIAEERDDRFWYVRAALDAQPELTEQPVATSQAAPSITPATQPALRTATSQAAESAMTASAPTASAATTSTQASPAPASAPTPREIRVGDTAAIRTQADVEQRRLVARVFEVAGRGALITAGERDGLVAGMVARVHRGGVETARVEVGRVQASYSEVRPAGEDASRALLVGDLVVFGELPKAPEFVGNMETVRGGTLFEARLLNADAPLGVPLTVASENGVIGGVVVLLARDGERGGGMALDASLIAPLRPGLLIRREPN